MMHTTLLSLLSIAAAQTVDIPNGVPMYAVAYAPIVYLYSGETYFPGNIGTQLENTHPTMNFGAIDGAASTYTLTNVNELNKYGNNGSGVYLSTNTAEWDYPSFLNGVKPSSTGQTEGAYSCAVIVNELDDGLVDVFYWYFYAFNYGGSFFGSTFDLHVGDWEYNVVRFHNGAPQEMWFSQHSYGAAFTWDALTMHNNGGRPVSFSANGSHANYRIPGLHPIPVDNSIINGVNDYADFGTLWDPIRSAYWYSYDNSTQKFTAYDNSSPTDWLYYNGAFGNQALPDSNPEQDCVPGEAQLCKWTAGPVGPLNHGLSRSMICPDAGNCPIGRCASG